MSLCLSPDAAARLRPAALSIPASLAEETCLRVLCVGDSPGLREAIGRALQHAGHVVEMAKESGEGARLALARSFDVAVIDIMPPRMDGLVLVELIRGNGCEVPVLLLIARDNVDDRVAAWNHGADDHLGVPFAFDELHARVRALARRFSGQLRPEAKRSPVTLYPETRVVTCGEQTLRLRPREYALLEHLALRKGTIVSCAEIEAHVFPDLGERMSNAVQATICLLRRRLTDAGALLYIHNVRGRGYRVSPDSVVSCVVSAAD